MKVALIGYGNVARALLRLLEEKGSAHPFEISGIRRRGPHDTSLREFLIDSRAEAMVELSTLNPETGEPASSHIREALSLGLHVVTANKGPIAHAWHELSGDAARRGLRLLFESTVMDGAPVFNQIRHNMPRVQVLGFTGVLNSTSKLVIEAMERGASFEEGIEQAKALGVAEENHEYDTQGWDSAAKTAALANVLLDARTTPAAVDRCGIHDFTGNRVRDLAREGKTVRIVSRGSRAGQAVHVSARAEILPKTDVLAAVAGTSNIILFHTDRMGTFGTVSISPGVDQTAYGIYVDLMELIRYPSL